MSDRLLSWFETRRKSKTLELAQNQIMKAIDTVSELERALIAFHEENIEEAEKRLDRLFQWEVEIDELRRAVFEELTKGELPTKYREDLKAIMGRLDRMADHIKDAARSLKILIKTKATVPKQISNQSLKMAKNLVECTRYLNMSIEALGTDQSKAREFAQKVDDCEGLLDEEHLNIKIMFFQVSEITAATLLTLRDLVETMERAADMCADTADYIRTLAIAEAS